MIKIRREGTKVQVRIEPGMADGKHILLEWECGKDWYAELLDERLRKRLGDAFVEMRREAYAQGYKDAKAKRKKATWFSRFFK